MLSTKTTTYLLTALLLLFPVAAHAFWWSSDDGNSGLNLESGYDANTVTTMTGRIISVQVGDEHHNAQLELESGGTRVVAVLGPQRYWAEKGFLLKVGDDITVRGSKAQGKDGTVYMLVQKITDTSLGTDVTLRNETGRPTWTGGSIRSGSGQMSNRPAQMRQQSPGRMGGGRMGR